MDAKVLKVLNTQRPSARRRARFSPFRMPYVPTAHPTNPREWLVLWYARLRTALRWCWQLDLALAITMATARVITGVGAHIGAVVEGNPLYRATIGHASYVPAAIAFELFVLIILLATQTWLVSKSSAGKRATLLATRAILILSAADAAWDLAQLFLALNQTT